MEHKYLVIGQHEDGIMLRHITKGELGDMLNNPDNDYYQGEPTFLEEIPETEDFYLCMNPNELFVVECTKIVIPTKKVQFSFN